MVHVQNLNLQLLLMAGVVCLELFPFSTQVWHCGTGTTTDTPNSKNASEAEGGPNPYTCDTNTSKYVTLAVFVNLNTRLETRVMPSVQRGVKLLKPHLVDYTKLEIETKRAWENISRGGRGQWRVVPQELKMEDRNSTIYPSTIVLVTQGVVECVYKNFSRGNSDSVHITNDSKPEANLAPMTMPPAVKVYSSESWHILDAGGMGGIESCSDSDEDLTEKIWSYYGAAEIESELNGQGSDEFINNGNETRTVTATYYEGLVDYFMQQNKILEPHINAKDDTQVLLSQLMANLKEMHSHTRTGLNWANYTVHDYGRLKKQKQITVPPNTVAKIFQSYAECNDAMLILYGWAYPVFIPWTPSHTSFDWYEGECQSPEFEMCLTRFGRAGPPEAYLEWSKCTDNLDRIQPSGNGTLTISIHYGVRGPFVSRLGESFMQKFQDKLNRLGSTSLDPLSVMFNWTTFQVKDVWTEYSSSSNEKVILLPSDVKNVSNLEVRQLSATCGMYSLTTKTVSFYEIDYQNRKMRCWNQDLKEVGCFGREI